MSHFALLPIRELLLRPARERFPAFGDAGKIYAFYCCEYITTVVQYH